MEFCRVHLVGRRRVQPAGCMAHIGWSGLDRPGSRLLLRASVAGLGVSISWRPPAYSLFTLFSNFQGCKNGHTFTKYLFVCIHAIQYRRPYFDYKFVPAYRIRCKKKLLKEFPSKSWCKRSLLRLTKKFKYQFSWQDIQGATDHNFTLWRMWPCCWPQVKPGRCGTDTSVSTWNFKKYWNLSVIY